MPLRNLIAAAAHAGVRIAPTLVDGHVHLSAEDVRRLDALTRHSRGRADLAAARIRRALDRRTDVVLTIPEAAQLTGDLGEFQAMLDRHDRISRGQYVGPMSASEAARFGRRLR